MNKRKASGCATVLGAVLVCLSLSPPPAQATPRDTLDIAGVRIGMTEAEVVAAMKAFDVQAVSERDLATFPYFDGVNSLQTPEFLDRLGFKTADSSFSVWFTSPPAESRVMAVFRRGSNAQPPGSEQMLSSLTDKYGPFSARSPARPGGHTVVHWGEDDKPQCTLDKDGSGQPVPWGQAVGTLLIPNAVNMLEQYARQRMPHLLAALGDPPDVSRCGTVLRYEWTSEPVQSFEAWLVDQGGMVATNRDSGEWVEKLKAEAVRKLQSEGQAPKL